MAEDTGLLNQNIQLLTQALTAMNQNMFNKTGGRSSVWGPGTSVPGTNSSRGGVTPEDKNTVKAIATNQLLTAAMKSNVEAVKYFSKNAAKSSYDLGQFTQKSAELFSKATANFSAKQLDDKLPKKLQTYLEKYVGKGIVPQLKSFEDVIKLQAKSNLKNIDSIVKMARAATATGVTLEQQQKVREELEKRYGVTANEFNQAVRDNGATLRENATKISEGTAQYSIKLAQAANNLDMLKKAGEILAGAVLAVGVDLYHTAVAAQKFGTTVTMASLVQAAYAGMTGEELMKVQNENIQAIHSSGIGFDGFNKKLDAGASELLAYTGSLHDGALVTANVFGTFRKLSANGKQLDGFEADQLARFKFMNRTLGMTSEQFVAMNEELTNNTSIQAQMYKVTADQRVNLLKGMQMQVQQLALDGLTIEQSKKLVESLAEITGGKAKDRYKQAAQIQGVLGALGLGREGQRAADIVRKGQRATPAELKELADIQVKAQRSVSSQYAQGNPAKEFQLDALTDVIGKFLGPNSAGAQVATSQGRAVDTQTAQAVAQTHALDGLTSVGQAQILWAEKQWQAIDAGFKSVATAFTKLFELMIGGKLLSGLGNILKLGGKTGALSTVGEATAGTAAVAALSSAAAVTAVTTAAMSAYHAIRGEDASNFISDFDKQHVGIGDALTGIFGGDEANQYNPNVNQPMNTTAIRKRLITQDEAKITDLAKGTQTEDTAKQIAELHAAIKRMTELQQKQLDATNKQTQAVVQGNQQAAAQADDQTKATKEIKETRNSARPASVT